MEIDFSIEEINPVAADLLKMIKDRRVVAFRGEMGAGKTTFIGALCDHLKAIGPVSSPTFSIINEYASKDGGLIFHLDLYRLKDEAEALQAGVEDCLYSGNYCFIEWPERAARLLPVDTVYCHISAVGQSTRKLRINL